MIILFIKLKQYFINLSGIKNQTELPRKLIFRTTVGGGGKDDSHQYIYQKPKINMDKENIK